MMELWVKIEEYDNYFVSNYGRVKSLDRRQKGEYIHGLRVTKDGYPKVTLTKNSKAKDYRIHRLVALYFVKNLEKHETVNHKDGDKLNNNYKNLEWMNRKEQLNHAYKLGLKKPVKGELNGNAVLTNAQAKKIREIYVKYSKNFNTISLGKLYNVKTSVIQDIISNKTYK